MNQTEVLRDLGKWNWTSAERVTITIQEHPPLAEDIVVIHVRLTRSIIRYDHLNMFLSPGQHRFEE
jgi:hypothetical protein